MGIWIFLLASGCFCAGYCLSGMLGYGTREDLEREAEELRRENARLMRSNLTLQEEIELMEKETRFREKTKVRGPRGRPLHHSGVGL